ncbi:MAG: IscS subfamily cysteine desulfurase [Chlorobi bacterium]|nr:IscS subfamily cysteine desulfurase [Chlorobiota bacterium]
MLKFPIYLDNHSTTQPDPRVVKVMLPFFTEIYGNASSSTNEFGWKAGAAVENARKQVSKLINSDSREIIFTSGATESINLAIKGTADAYSHKGNHIITVKTEHKAGLDSCKSLEKKGYAVTYLSVDKYGLIDLDELKNAITGKTILVSVMYANNEIGTIQHIEDIANICKEKGVLFHTDATQAVGKIALDVSKLNIDLLSFSAHKMHGPKGVGALYIKNKSPKIKITPQTDGGEQEKDLRAGTLNVPGIVGFGKACEIALNEMDSEISRIKNLRDTMYNGIISQLDEVYLNGHPDKRLVNNLNLSFKYVNSDALMMSMKEIALSTGSACSSGSMETSHVLNAINISEDLRHSAVRFGLGRFNNDEEIQYTIHKVVEKVNYLRKISPAYQMAKKGVYAEP